MTPSSATSFQGFDFGSGLSGWAYDYWNCDRREHHGIASVGLELGIQLSGDWQQTTALGWEQYQPSEIHRLQVGERYSMRFASPYGRSTQMGFILQSDDWAELSLLMGTSTELTFPGDAGRRDRRLVELCKELTWGAMASVSPREVRRELLLYLGRHSVATSIDPLTRARRELERHIQSELYMHHLAEVAGMHPTTFARRFKKRFGQTPASYRVSARLNHALHLLRARVHPPTVVETAERSGFNDLRYFRRSFLRRFGVLPSAVRRRTTEGIGLLAAEA